jgi:hypothetical protein
LPTYATPKPETITAEDKIIGAYPLQISPSDITILPVDDMFARTTRQ